MDEPVDPSTPEAKPSHEHIPDAVPMARPLTGLEPEIPATARIEHDMLIPTSSRGRAIGDVGRFILLFILAQLVAEFLIRTVYAGSLAAGAEDTANAQPARIRERLPQMLAVVAVLSIVAIRFILRTRQQSFRSIGLHAGNLWINGWIGIAASIAIPILIWTTLSGLYVFYPQLAELMEENSQRIQEIFPNIGPAGFVAVAIMIGTYEEIVFRGFIMTRLRRFTGSWTGGVFLSTIIFVAPHAVDQTISALIAITILSLAFSALTVWRRSIVPAIIAHTLFDLAQFLLLSDSAGDAWT